MKKVISLYCYFCDQGTLEQIELYVQGIGVEVKLIAMDDQGPEIPSAPNPHFSLFLICHNKGSAKTYSILKKIRNNFLLIPTIVIGSGNPGEKISSFIREGTGSFIDESRLYTLPDELRKLLLQDPLEDLSPDDMLQHYEFLLNISGSQLSMIDRNFNYLVINEAFCLAHNLIRDEVVGKTPAVIWGEEKYRKFIKPKLEKCFTQEKIHYRAWFDIREDERRFFEVSFIPHISREEDVDYIVVETKDITQEELVRIDLKTSNEDLKLLNSLNELLLVEASHKEIGEFLCNALIDIFEGFTANLYYYDPEASLLIPIRFKLKPEMIEKIEEITGNNLGHVRVKQVDSSYYLDILDKGGIVQIVKKSQIKKAISGMIPGEYNIYIDVDRVLESFPISGVLMVPLRSGKEKLGMLTLTRFNAFNEDEIKRIRNISGQITNILLIRRRENEKRQQAKKLQLLFDSAPDAIFFLEQEKFIDCNPRTLDMFKVKRDEIIGHTPVEFSPEYQPGGKSSLSMALEYIRKAFAGTPQSFEWVHTRKDGTPFYALVSLNKIELNDHAYVQALVRDIDEMKRTYIELGEKEKALREAQDIAGLGSWDLNLITGEHTWSPQAYKILEYNPKKVNPSREMLAKRIHPDDRKRVAQTIDDVIRTMSTIDIEYRLKMPDSRIKYIHAIGIVTVTKSGPEKFRGTIHDVTKIKLAEIAISERSAQLNIINKINSDLNQGKSIEQIVKNMTRNLSRYIPVSNIVIFAADLLPGRYSLLAHTFSKGINQKMIDILEQKVHHLYIPPGDDNLIASYFHHPEREVMNDPALIKRMLKDFLALLHIDQPLPEIINLLKIRSVMYFPVMKANQLEYLMMLFSKEELNGKFSDQLESILDQLRIAIAKKLDEMEMQRLQTAVNQMDEMMFISDMDGVILYMNPTGERLTGIPIKEFLGRNTRDFRHPEVDLAVFDNIWRMVTKGMTWQGELKLLSATKKKIFVHTIITPIRDAKGRVQFFVTLMRDITREIEMRHYMQRSQNLEMIGRFAGGLAHDFNNILATMLGYGDMVLDEIKENDVATDYLNKLKKSGIRARELIQQLLTFNRSMEPGKTRFSPLEAVKEALELIQPQMENKVTIVIDRVPEELVLLADRIQFKQVILNLFSNALHAVNDKPSGKITMKGEQVDKLTEIEGQDMEELTGPVCRFEISDNGTGMDKNTVDHIFEPFFTTKPVGRGSGMGLSVVYGIVAAHNGKIFVKSKPGKGTVFTLYFPNNSVV